MEATQEDDVESPNGGYQDWTSCQMYGHGMRTDDGRCMDCGEGNFDA
jgi:hypothetical protein